MTIELVKAQPVYVAITSPVTHRCPIDGSTDSDRVEVKYRGHLGIVEVRSWEEYLSTFEHMAVTAEELAVMIRDDLLTAGIAVEMVTVHGDHGDGTFIEAYA